MPSVLTDKGYVVFNTQKEAETFQKKYDAEKTKEEKDRLQKLADEEEEKEAEEKAAKEKAEKEAAEQDDLFKKNSNDTTNTNKGSK